MWAKLKEYDQNPTKLHVTVKEQVNVGVFHIYLTIILHTTIQNEVIQFNIFSAWYITSRYANPWAWLNE
jgi:hypothetical protein